MLLNPDCLAPQTERSKFEVGWRISGLYAVYLLTKPYILVSASGYLQGGVWSEAQHPYGHRIRDTAMGSLHDHVINYKVDFDVAGTNNSLMQMKLEVEDKFEPWFADDWGTVSMPRLQ